ncbi:hypothetical protein HGRIS_012709 [Hohenbuehelia grisea]|uniref:Uncharacterized protein n=1 Tax=Hohenbuehelia grisea TaxID=104357 RepID=A0ABR3IT56_9AGAR
MADCLICGNCTYCFSESSHSQDTDHCVQPIDAADSPFRLDQLLPIGSFCLTLGSGIDNICDHVHRQDGWHNYPGHELLKLVASSTDDQFCRQLTFLLENHFLAATSRLSDESKLVTRVYLIPYDLPRVHGILRNRLPTVLATARRYLKEVLDRVRFDKPDWSADTICLDAHLPCDLTTDDRTLAEIYGDLPSPVPPSYDEPASIQARLINLGDDLSDLGLRYPLHPYQRTTVAQLLSRERSQTRSCDPLYLPLRSLDGKPFYFQPGTYEILRDCPLITPARGGILCEELGTGKTLMVLALVLASRDQISSPEDSVTDVRPVLTQTSLLYFPSDPYQEARNRCRRRLDSAEKSELSKCPSLVELLLHRMRTSPCESTEDISDILDPVGLRSAYKAIHPFYHHYLGEPTTVKRSRRKAEPPAPKIMYLTKASLIVVPANLIGQWDQEIHKHCASHLQVLILRSSNELPGVKQLASDYDIILMTYERFTAEDRKKDVSKLHSFQHCKCPLLPLERIRVPDCTCPEFDVSPLLQIRWKRLVIDEGHNSATTSTILTPLVKLLSVQSKWIVTGTPTSNLLGLSFGEKSAEMIVLAPEEDEEMDVEHISGDRSRDVSPSGASSESSRVWTKADRQDLNKLSIMMTHFIGMPQFLGNPDLFKSTVMEALMDRRGARPGAIQVLTQLMGSVMIRHRIEDVEKDVALPSITKENILLDLEPLAARSYNVMQALIAINAVDSERVGQDYIFHITNGDALQRTVTNMSQIMAWSVDTDKLYNIHENMGEAEKYIENAKRRGVSAADMDLLQTALNHIREAAEDHVWRQSQASEECPYKVVNLQRELFDAWSRMPSMHPPAITHDPEIPSTSDHSAGYIHSDRLRKLRDAVLAHPLSSVERLVSAGQLVQDDDRTRLAILNAKLAPSSKGKSRDSKHSKGISATMTSPSKNQLRQLQLNQASTLPTPDESWRNDTIVVRRIMRPLTTDESPTVSDSTKFLRDSPLGTSRIGNSASSKVNYIMNEVMQHSANEKILIFSQSPLTLAHVSDALELLQIKFLQFTTQVNSRMREQLVVTFETSETHRVFLMELKHGARGLNLISASRVIFCEPVWQADVESQAIKRVHRIGQTKPVTVKALAIRNTSEEYMVTRRNTLKDTQSRFPKLIEEEGMRWFIAHPKFVTSDPAYLPTVNLPLLQLPDVPPEMHMTTSPQDGEPQAAASIDRGPVAKKRRTVAFVDID